MNITLVATVNGTDQVVNIVATPEGYLKVAVMN